MIKPPRAPEEQDAIALVDLRPNDCRYPVRSGEGRGEYYFCGKPKWPESQSYCKKHHFECNRVLGVTLHRHAGVT